MVAVTSAELIDCPDCGTLQQVPRRASWTVLICQRCSTVLERSNLRNIRAAFALSSAALLLILPAITFPFLTTSILGASRTSRLWSSSTAMFNDGWPTMAIVIFSFTVLAPLARLALLSTVLGAVHFGRNPSWLGRAFRYACALETWAMADVYLLGMAVAYARLKASLNVELGTGGECFIAVGILTLFIRGVLDKGEVWRKIGIAGRPEGVGGGSLRPERIGDHTCLTCQACDRVTSVDFEGRHCPRCGKILHRRKPEAVQRAVALTIAGAILYIPANVYPIATLPIGFSSVKYNVLEGVVDLVHAGLYGLALLVLTASFAIPLLKLIGLMWCIASVELRSTRHLRLKTRVFGGIEEIGRWSMIDPFVISCFVPVTHYNSFIYGRAEPAATAFTAVVILTIVATKCFDPRLMWDVSGRHR